VTPVSPLPGGFFTGVLFGPTALTTSTFSLPQNDLNWLNLSQERRDYFHHLAAGDSSRNGQEFFEDTVPQELHSHPDLVDKYLDGDADLGVSDKDWSHDVSRDNGGSDSADNGRFEDSSTNRSRGADNTTEQEVFEADVESDEDVRTLLESANDVAEASSWAFVAEGAASVGEFALDAFAPLVGGGVAAKAVYDHFEEPKDKWGWGSLAGGLTAAVLCTPPGQLCVAGYVGYRVLKRGSNLVKKHFPAS